METTATKTPTNAEWHLLEMLKEMNNDYDNGLREFQDAIHYAIFHMFVGGSKNCNKKNAVTYILYLRDLADRLHSMEDLMKHPD